MSRRAILLLIIIIVIIFTELYSFQAIKAITKQKIFRYLWIGISLCFYGYAFFIILKGKLESGQTREIQYAIGAICVILIPKLVLILPLLGEDIFRFSVKLFTANRTIQGRRRFISQIALGLASIPLTGLIYGIFKGKYNFKVIKHDISFHDLPESFDGLRITHITDIHSGSFDNKEKIEYAVDLINQQKSDLILFTGDIVNNFASEMDEWIDTFKKLDAPLGKYSILGNHDYGDYSEWNSKEEKEQNFQDILKAHEKIGFDLLLNENRLIEKNGQKITLVGVENWGRGFKKKGDLNIASKGVHVEDFKILLSHDPSHWEEKVMQDEFNYQLTLSGHTHGMQFGIEIPGFIKWSPSRYVYKYWGGLYKEFGRFLNVNRGFGYHAFPGRVGIWPEITVLKLTKNNKTETNI